MQINRTLRTLTLALCGLAALAPFAQARGEFEKEFEVDPGQKIELDMKEGGSLEVVGWDEKRVKVLCTTHRIDIEDWDIEVDETRHGLRLRARIKDRSIRSHSFHVHLMVPREFDISTRSGGGEISITGVSGTFEGKTGGGGITLRNVSGKARLTTGGGWIEIVDSDLNGKVSSGGGGGVLRNVTGNVRASSGGGAVRYENVRNVDGDLRGPGRMTSEDITEGTLIHKSAGGGIHLDEAPDGAIVQTGGGDIRIEEASRIVIAKTGGGDIEIEIDDGKVEAVTGAGDIEVIVEDGLGRDAEGIDLKTGHGEIDLILPADASVRFDLDLAYTRNSSRGYDIESDFDLEIERTTEWETRHGSPRKHIYGSASINGGKHLVTIRCVNGDINIEKR